MCERDWDEQDWQEVSEREDTNHPLLATFKDSRGREAKMYGDSASSGFGDFWCVRPGEGNYKNFYAHDGHKEVGVRYLASYGFTEEVIDQAPEATPEAEATPTPAPFDLEGKDEVVFQGRTLAAWLEQGKLNDAMEDEDDHVHPTPEPVDDWTDEQKHIAALAVQASLTQEEREDYERGTSRNISDLPPYAQLLLSGLMNALLGGDMSDPLVSAFMNSRQGSMEEEMYARVLAARNPLGRVR